MHYSRHRLTASVTTWLGACTRVVQWARPACPLVSLSKTEPCQFSSITSLCMRLNVYSSSVGDVGALSNVRLQRCRRPVQLIDPTTTNVYWFSIKFISGVVVGGRGHSLPLILVHRKSFFSCCKFLKVFLLGVENSHFCGNSWAKLQFWAPV